MGISLQEIRKMFEYILKTIATPWVFFVEWHYWRRRHQALAKTYHWRRQQRVMQELQL